MPDEILLSLLSLFNLIVISASVVAMAFVTRKLLRDEPLVPYIERPDYDIGGPLGWPVRHLNRKWDVEAPPPKKLSWQTVLGDIRLGGVAFLVSFVPVMVLQAVLDRYVKYDHPLISEAKSHFWWVAFQALIEAPLLEEFIFRNFLQGCFEVLERGLIFRSSEDSRERVESRWPFGVMPIILSSVFFAAAHWEHGAAAAPLFLFALVLGYLYFQTHRLLPSIVAHAALNGFSMVQLAFLQQS